MATGRKPREDPVLADMRERAKRRFVMVATLPPELRDGALVREQFDRHWQRWEEEWREEERRTPDDPFAFGRAVEWVISCLPRIRLDEFLYGGYEKDRVPLELAREAVVERLFPLLFHIRAPAAVDVTAPSPLVEDHFRVGLSCAFEAGARGYACPDVAPEEDVAGEAGAMRAAMAVLRSVIEQAHSEGIRFRTRPRQSKTGPRAGVRPSLDTVHRVLMAEFVARFMGLPDIRRIVYRKRNAIPSFTSAADAVLLGEKVYGLEVKARHSDGSKAARRAAWLLVRTPGLQAAVGIVEAAEEEAKAVVAAAAEEKAATIQAALERLEARMEEFIEEDEEEGIREREMPAFRTFSKDRGSYRGPLLQLLGPAEPGS